jgi:deubiquitinase DESI2
VNEWHPAHKMPDVILIVYDLPEQSSRNNSLFPLGFGFYHSGVEFNGFEYSFSADGISKTRSLLPDFGVVREVISMGSYPGSTADFNLILNEFRSGTFGPGKYDVVGCNCNHFSDAMCYRLVGTHIPGWVNRAAEIGNSVTGGSASSGRSNTLGSATSLPAPGVVKAPTLQSNDRPVASHDAAAAAPDDSGKSGSDGGIFSWFFGNSAASNKQPNSSSAVAAPDLTTPPGTDKTTSKKKSSAKKELTERQKEMLAKIKGGNSK